MHKRIKFFVIAGVAALMMALTAPAYADFVCPVLPISDQAVAHSEASFITISGGDTSILPGKAGSLAESPVNVPDDATNANGAGSPGGSYSVPGQSGYSAIWNTP